MKKFTSLIAMAIVALVFAFSVVIPAQAQPAQSPKMVRVIIGYKNQPSNVDMQRIKGYGGQTGYTYHIMPVTTATVPENRLRLLRNSPNVAYVEEDVEVKALDDSTPWGVSKVHADAIHPYNEGAGGWGTGTNGAVKVAIIDTGIDIDHPDLNVQGGVNLVSSAGSYDDDNGHGTHVAGTVAALDNGIGVVGVAPQAALYAVKVLNSSGLGYLSTVASGVEWAIDNQMQIINMSLGASSGSLALQNACNNAWAAGIILVAAAGNSGAGTNTLVYPALYNTSVISVAATDSSNTRASFSSTGPTLELSAPGYSIESTYAGGGYRTLNGTSMASPHVAGVAALILASGIPDTDLDGLHNDEVRARLTSTALHLGTGGAGTRNNQYGYGLVDANKAAGIDHYTVSNVNLIQNNGVAFNVVLHAKDVNNNDVISSEILDLTFAKPDSGATPTQIPTTNGVGSADITMTEACTGQQITFTGQTSHKYVRSAIFTVESALDHIIVTPSDPQAPQDPQVLVDGQMAFTAKGYTENDILISGLSYEWSIDPDAGIIVVDPNDSSKAIFTAGTTGGDFDDAIQATCPSFTSVPAGTASVTVVADSALISVTIDPTSATVSINGGTQQFTAQGHSADDAPIFGITYSWSRNGGGTLSSSEGVSTTFTAGTVAGPYTIEAKYITNETTPRTLTITAPISVPPGPLNRIDVSPPGITTVPIPDISIPGSGTQLFTARGYDQYTNEITSGLTYAWSIDPAQPAAGSIVPVTGVFTAGTVAGTYTNAIRATCGTVVGKASVTVPPDVLDHILIDPSVTVISINGGVGSFHALGKDKYNNLITSVLPFNWSTYPNPTVAGSINVDPAHPGDSSWSQFTAGTVANTYTNVIQATCPAYPSVAAGTATVSVSSLHVYDVLMVLYGRSTSSAAYAKATLTITNGDVPVGGALVTGHWISGYKTTYVSGYTAANGKVTLQSSSLRRPPSNTVYTLVIDNITKSGLVYDPALNIATDSGPGIYSVRVP